MPFTSNEQSDTTVDDMCRLCTDKCNMLGCEIFSTEGEERQIITKIGNCLPLNINEYDLFPKNICPACVYKLDSFNDFREKCLEAELFFLSVFRSNINVPTIFIVNDDELKLKIEELADNNCANNAISINNTNISDSYNNQLDKNDGIFDSEIEMGDKVNFEINQNTSPVEEEIFLNIVNETEHDFNIGNDTEYIDDDNDDNFIDDNLTNDSNKSIHFEKLLNSEREFEENKQLYDAKVNKNEKPQNFKATETYSKKICDICNKKCQSNYKLKIHMKTHTGETPFVCVIENCKKSFRSKIGLTEHEATHTGKYQYSCPTCGKGFQIKSYLSVHQRVHSNAKPFSCTECKQTFKAKQALIDHINRHNGIKPFSCEQCGKRFITKGLCDLHQNIHTGNSLKYPCKICNKLFVAKSYLKVHMRIHTNERPFSCEDCGRCFLTRVDLRSHATTHTGEKKYICDICGKTFARANTLKSHKRAHTGERPYKCTICGQTFSQRSPLTTHMRLHTGERPYKCQYCALKFVSKSSLGTHMKKH